MPKHHIIYISGLGDHYDVPRKAALRMWRLLGVGTELVAMQWYDGNSYDQKFAKITQAVDSAIARSQTVSLVGESAGATIALNIFANDTRIKNLVTVCGVVDPKANVSPRIYAKSPAFKKSMERMGASLGQLNDRVHNVHVITARHDSVVNQDRNVIPYAAITRMPVSGHLTAICFYLVFFAKKTVKLLDN